MFHRLAIPRSFRVALSSRSKEGKEGARRESYGQNEGYISKREEGEGYEKSRFFITPWGGGGGREVNGGNTKCTGRPMWLDPAPTMERRTD